MDRDLMLSIVALIMILLQIRMFVKIHKISKRLRILEGVVKILSEEKIRLKFSVKFTDVNGQIIIKEDVRMVTLLDNQKLAITKIEATSVKGNPAVIDGVPTWSISDDTLLSLEVAGDSLSAIVHVVGPVGNAQVMAKADADTGEGIEEITGIMDIEILASKAASLTLTAGTPENE